MKPKNQKERILALLRKYPNNWVSLKLILKLGVAQYNARIFELRKDYTILNVTEWDDGEKYSWYKLVISRPHFKNTCFGR